jgi:hypothetical protein
VQGPPGGSNVLFLRAAALSAIPLGLEICREDQVSYDSSLEQDGFELVVPPLVSQLAGQPRKRSRSARRRARPFPRGTNGSNPLSSGGESGKARGVLRSNGISPFFM